MIYVAVDVILSALHLRKHLFLLQFTQFENPCRIFGSVIKRMTDSLNKSYSQKFDSYSYLCLYYSKAVERCVLRCGRELIQNRSEFICKRDIKATVVFIRRFASPNSYIWNACMCVCLRGVINAIAAKHETWHLEDFNTWLVAPDGSCCVCPEQMHSICFPRCDLFNQMENTWKANTLVSAIVFYVRWSIW